MRNLNETMVNGRAAMRVLNGRERLFPNDLNIGTIAEIATLGTGSALVGGNAMSPAAADVSRFQSDKGFLYLTTSVPAFRTSQKQRPHNQAGSRGRCDFVL